MRPNSNIIKGKQLQIFDTQLQITTWDVRSFLHTDKLANAVKKMRRLNIDILGLSEVRWPGIGFLKADGIHIYFSGGPGSKNGNGVTIMLSDEIAKSVVDFIPLSNRIMLFILEEK